jgi:4-amino-4-deoxy-L-arabinose transferase-like glycosyltransferase
VADRAGLIAAALAAIYPNLWINDALILSESLAAGLIALVIFCAYRFWDHCSWRNAALLGVSVAAVTLTRSEGLLLLPGLVLPLALVLKDQSWRHRLTLAVGTGAIALALMAPWMTRNVATFNEPAPPFLATGSGRVLAFGNCDATYSGKFLGYWNIECAPSEFSGDESEIDTIHREKATEYMQDHLDELPKVMVARVGRMWHLYRVDEGLEFDRFFERRGLDEVKFALAQFYVMVPVAIAGGVLLWRRRVTLIPLVAPFVLVTFTAATTFGITRYRVPSEVALTILAGLGTAWVTARARDAEPEPAPVE